MQRWALLVPGLLFGACAPAGSGCDPVPGGFAPEARIEGAVQLRLTGSGLTFLGDQVAGLAGTALNQTCGSLTDVPCPTGFVDPVTGAPLTSTCDVNGVCAEPGGTPGPYIAFEIPRTVDPDVEVCRDDPADPNRRRCDVWVRLDDVHLGARAPDIVSTTLSVQLQSTEIPIRYNPLGMDCTLAVDTTQSGSPSEPLLVELRLSQFIEPGQTNGPLWIQVETVDVTLPNEDLVLAADPVFGDIFDTALCGLGNVDFVKGAVLAQLSAPIADVVRTQVATALGRTCGADDPACPSSTTCNADGFCEDANGAIIPAEQGTEGRIDLADGELSTDGFADFGALLGGASAADATGLRLGALSGAELAESAMTCAVVESSPRLRSGFVPPANLPGGEQVDLDFDGTPETPYMVAVGISQAILNQTMWIGHGSGILCQGLTTEDVPQLNTGALSLVIPSLDRLTHADRDPDAVFPVQMFVTVENEPTVTIGPGQNSGQIADSLLQAQADDVEIQVYAQIEERWILLFTSQLDILLGAGLVVTGQGALRPVVDGVEVTDVRISNADILGDDPEELAEALPVFVELALPQLTGALPEVPLPPPEALLGLDLQILGIRGAPGPHVVVYANLALPPP